MDRKQLRALLAVADHRSVLAAARSLDTVESNVPAHVARLVRALGVTHARDGFNIRPELYDLWLVSLQQAIGDHDKACNADILQAWREVLSKGINVIKSEY